MSLKKNPRIVHYYPRALVGNGGCSRAVRGWAAAVARAGAEVLVACDQDGERPPGNEVDWRPLPHRGRSLARAPEGLEQYVDGADFLVLHSGWVYHNALAARIAERTSVPYVLTPHGAYDPNVVRRKKTLKRIWWRLVEHGVLARASAMHVFFEEERDFLGRLGYRGPVIVAPNGVSIPEPEERQDGTEEYVLWMGRFDIEHKGIDLLLHALAAIPEGVRPQTRLHGPDWHGGKQRAIMLARRLDLERVVTIDQPLYGREKWKALRNCRLFVFPSRWEAQGLVALEAAGVGAALVTTNTTFVGRELASGGAAFLADANPQSIATAIVESRSHDTLMMGARGIQLVKERFSWGTVASDYLRQLEALR
jgi:glycosyltransferase involved in cell wall biosynthesis